MRRMDVVVFPVPRSPRRAHRPGDLSSRLLTHSIRRPMAGIALRDTTAVRANSAESPQLTASSNAPTWACEDTKVVSLLRRARSKSLWAKKSGCTSSSGRAGPPRSSISLRKIRWRRDVTIWAILLREELPRVS